MSEPLRVDNELLTDATDFDALALAALRGDAGGSLRSDNFPLDWVLRAYHALHGSAYADRLARGVATCLTAAEPAVRAQALVFYESHPTAAGGERVNFLVADDQGLFAGIANPMQPGYDLRWQLLTVLAARANTGDRRATDLARVEAMRPGSAAPVIGGLVAADPDWVLAHAEEIVGGTPAAGATILIRLQRTDRDMAAIGRRIAPLCRDDARFEDAVSRFIDDPDLRQAILDAFHATDR